MILQFLIFSILQKIISSVCWSYFKGDVYFNKSVLNSSYCAPVITWPITDVTINNYLNYDQTAQSMYSKLYQRYIANNDSALTLDCLGIAQFTFCAYSYPSCEYTGNSSLNASSADINKMCNWICDLWLIRCPSQIDLYNAMCNDQSKSNCSHQYYLRYVILVMILILIL